MFSLGLNLWSTTILARGGSADGYAVGGFSPSLVFDFAEDYYRTGGSATTFSDAVTFSRASNATMVDSDGVLKWAPHNLLTYSEDFTQWTAQNVTVESDAIAGPSVGSSADFIRSDNTTGDLYTFISYGSLPESNGTLKVYVKANGFDTVYIYPRAAVYGVSYFVLSGAGSTSGSGINSITALSDGWYLIETERSSLPTNLNNFHLGICDAAGSVTATGDGVSGVYVWGAQSHRSDLGGMVNNPDRGDSYVPTTSSAVYLPRRGHHVYNGSAWVNEGLLHESEQRVNLLTYSNDFAQWTNETSFDEVSSTVGPDGSAFMTLLYEDTATNRHILYRSLSGALDVTRTFSVFVKKPQANGLQYVVLSVPNTSDTLAYSAVFDLDSGLVTATNVNGTATISLAEAQDFGNGIYRCILSGNSNSATSASFFPMIALSDRSDFSGTLVSGNIPSYTGDGTSGIYIWGAQLEEASTPSSYIPTSGATATRAAETLTIPAANLPWPSPVVIGEELVTNGTFDTDTSGWTVFGDCSVVSGEAVIADVGGTDGAISQQLSGVVTGDVLILTFDQSAGTNLFVQVGFSAGSNFDGQFSGYGVGSHGIIFVAKRDAPWVTFRSFFTDTSNTIDNISVKEINPLSVSIQMQGEATGDSYTPLRWYKDANNYITQNIGTSDFTFTQANAGVVDSVAGGSFTSGVNSAFNFASTHASTFVAAAVNGTSLTANTTPTALTDLSATDAQIGYDFNGTIQLVRVWADDITATGREEASTNA